MITAKNPETYGLDLYVKFSWTPNNARLSVDNAVHHFGPNELYEFNVAVSNLGPPYRTTGTLSVTFTDWVGLLTVGSAEIPFILSTGTQPTTLSVQVTTNDGKPLNKLVTAKWNSGTSSDSKWSGTSGTAVFELGSGYAYEGYVEVTVQQETRNFQVTEGDNTGTIVLYDQPSDGGSSLPPYLIYALFVIIGIAAAVTGGLVLMKKRKSKTSTKPDDMPPPPPPFVP